MEKQCILVVDDNKEIVRAISIYLEKESYDILCAYDGVQAVDFAMSRNIHLVLIDVIMPRQNGLAAILKIRETRNLLIIVLSAKLEDSDKILGLSMGVDDYITKLFNLQELVAWVKSQPRRYTTLGDTNSAAQNLITIGHLTFDTDNHTLTADGESVRLTATETKIAELLMKNAGRIFPVEEIYRRVWSEPALSAENTVMIHIRHVREKIEINPKEPECLKVVWGIGYKTDKLQKSEPAQLVVLCSRRGHSIHGGRSRSADVFFRREHGSAGQAAFADRSER